MTTNDDLVSVDALKELLAYNPTTGQLFWRRRSLEAFSRKRLGLAWNARWAGKLAMTTKNARHNP